MPSMLLSLISVIVTLGVSRAHGQETTCDPPAIAHGLYTPNETKYRLEDVIRYRCDNGFYPSSRGNRAKCTDGGWAPPPRCSDKPCEYPEIKHGNLYRARREYFPVAVGQWYYYSCSDSYVTRTERYWDYITCTPDGWSPDVPCLKHCDMPLFENATAIITGKAFRPNDTLDYQCLDGYETRDGHTKGSMVCGKDGWSHLPSCFKSAEKCGPPPAVSNGDTTSFPLAAYPPGSRVEYKCQAYYELRGPNYITCIDAKWSEPPKCLDACVISEEMMEKHNIQLKWRQDKKLYSKTGDTVEFICRSGYREKSPGYEFWVMCQEGKLMYPTCE